MNKSEFIDAVAAAHPSLSRAELARVLQTILDTLGQQIQRGRSVQLTGFGTFSTTRHKARTGRNPKTGEPVRIPANTLPKFTAGAKLKALVATNKK